MTQKYEGWKKWRGGSGGDVATPELTPASKAGKSNKQVTLPII